LANDFASSRRLDGLAVPDIVQIKQRATALARAGRNIIDLSIGEPDFSTLRHIQMAAQEAMQRAETHYTATAGTLELREASRFNRKRNCDPANRTDCCFPATA
jgi:aspartate/methionine/tyrosine aminotransferase